MASDGKYSVTLVLQLDVTTTVIVDSEDEDSAHDDAANLRDALTTSISDRIQKTLAQTKKENPQLDDITETECVDYQIKGVEELEAPVTDKEDEA